MTTATEDLMKTKGPEIRNLALQDLDGALGSLSRTLDMFDAADALVRRLRMQVNSAKDSLILLKSAPTDVNGAAPKALTGSTMDHPTTQAPQTTQAVQASPNGSTAAPARRRGRPPKASNPNPPEEKSDKVVVGRRRVSGDKRAVAHAKVAFDCIGKKYGCPMSTFGNTIGRHQKVCAYARRVREEEGIPMPPQRNRGSASKKAKGRAKKTVKVKAKTVTIASDPQAKRLNDRALDSSIRKIARAARTGKKAG